MTNPAQKSTGRPKKGSIQDISRKLYRAIERATSLLEEEDPTLRLKAIHALSQASLNYSKITEISELEARINALEGKERKA